MIRGMHAMFYSSQADALRAFLKDKLGLPLKVQLYQPRYAK
jgi:hypothetical protein